MSQIQRKFIVAPSVTVYLVNGVNIPKSEDFVLANFSTPGSLNLPTAVGRKYPLYLKNIGTAQTTFTPVGAEQIDGSTGPITIMNQNTVSLVPQGGNWWIY